MDILVKLKQLKPQLESDGFIIDAVFGSYASGDFNVNSDVDLLYHVDKNFVSKYGGFNAFKKLEEIKQFLMLELGKNVDLAPSNNLSKSAKKHIFKKVIDVS